MDASLSVLDYILRERPKGSREHKAACDIVEVLDSEACLQLGMLADSAHDVIALTRFFDRGTYEVAGVMRILCEFQKRCTDMWMKGGLSTGR